MAELALLCWLGIQAALVSWLVARVRLLSRQVSVCLKRAPAPTAWESKLRELAADQACLSSNFEKVAKGLTRLNTRAGMRELREREAGAQTGPPPPGASKSQLREYYKPQIVAATRGAPAKE